jgi:hypothetical protein
MIVFIFCSSLIGERVKEKLTSALATSFYYFKKLFVLKR